MQKTRKKSKSTYASERRRFIEWLEEARYQAVMSNYGNDNTNAANLPQIKSEGNGTYIIDTDHKAETVDDGYAYMMTGVLSAMKTCRYCEDAKEVIRTALQGYELFYPISKDCRECSGKGRVNRTILKGIVKADVAFNLNSTDNSWFYVSADSIFNRAAAVCFGLFDIASLLPSFINVTIGEGDGGDRAAVIGGKKALQDIWKYFKEYKPKKVTLDEMLESLREGKMPYGEIWGSFYEFQGQELLDEEEYISMLETEIECESMEDEMCTIVCPPWEAVEEVSNLLINKALTFNDMSKDMRNGYIFFMSNVREWIARLKGSTPTAFPLVSTLAYLISGIDRLENPIYYNGEKTERVVHYYELLNAMLMEDESVMDWTTWLQFLTPEHPECSIISEQITAVTTMLLYTGTFFGLPYLPVTVGEMTVEGIENVGDRMEGIIGAMADLLNSTGLTPDMPIYADIREKAYHGIIYSLIDSLTIYKPEPAGEECEEA